MAFCTNCGSMVGDDHKFCRECGKPTSDAGHGTAEQTRAGSSSSNAKAESGGFVSDGIIRDAPASDDAASGSPAPGDFASGGTADAPASDDAVPDDTRHADTVNDDRAPGNFAPAQDAKDSAGHAEDRRTMFDEGILVLTPDNAILYSSRTEDELERIPISQIADCSYSSMRRCLLIKKMINMERNLDAYQNELKAKQEKQRRSLAELEGRLKRLNVQSDSAPSVTTDTGQADTKSRWSSLQDGLRSAAGGLASRQDSNTKPGRKNAAGKRASNTKSKKKNAGKQISNAESKTQIRISNAESQMQKRQEEAKKISSKMRSMQRKIDRLEKDISALATDPKVRSRTMRQKADIKKEQFTLPRNHLGEHAPRDEYKIWKYAVQRRIKGPLMLRIVTEPYDAVIRINRKPIATAPATIELPLMDDAILDGKYQIEVLKEGCELVRFAISTKLTANEYGSSMYRELAKSMLHSGKRLHSRHFKLKPAVNDRAFENMVKSLREEAPDRSISLADSAIELETKCMNETLILAKDSLFVVSRDGRKCLYEIPYGAIIKASCGSKVYGRAAHHLMPKSIAETKLGRMIGQKSRSIQIRYDELHYKNLSLEFELDNQDKPLSEADALQHMNRMQSILDRKMAEPDLYCSGGMDSDRFVITQEDIQNNFERFEPFEFEVLVQKLFESKGYKAEVTQERGDMGVDVLARSKRETIAIQVKHWRSSVGGPDVHKTVGSMVTFGASRAMVITTSDFTVQAYDIQRRGSPVELWNGAKTRAEFQKYLARQAG